MDHLYDKRALSSLAKWPSVQFGVALAVLNLGYGFLIDTLDRADGELVMHALTGCMIAEVAVLPAWLVWGSGPFLWRLGMHAFLMAMLAVLFFGGMLPFLYGDNDVKGFGMILLSLPIVSLAVSAPLWLVRLFFGWRIVHPSQASDDDTPLSIRDLLVAMAIVGVALAMARLAMAVAPVPGYWLAMGIAVGIAGAAALLVELPIVWFAFRVREPVVSALAVGAIMLLAWLVMIVVATAVDGRVPDGIIALFLFCQGLGYTTAAAFWIARAAGYRLVAGQRK